MLVHTKIVKIIVCGHCGSDELLQTHQEYTVSCAKCQNMAIVTTEEKKIIFDLWLYRKITDKNILLHLAR
jgi:hypothetical protein